MNISAKELAQWLDGSRHIEVVDVRREDQRKQWPLRELEALETDLDQLSPE